MVEEGDVVSPAHDAAFRRARPGAGGVGDDAVADFPAEVEARAVFFQLVDDAQALPVVGKPAGAQAVQRALARVAKRRVAQVMAERDGLGQILIEAQRPGDGARDLADFQRVGQAGAVMVAFRREKDLRFLL